MLITDAQLLTAIPTLSATAEEERADLILAATGAIFSSLGWDPRPTAREDLLIGQGTATLWTHYTPVLSIGAVIVRGEEVPTENYRTQLSHGRITLRGPLRFDKGLEITIQYQSGTEDPEILAALRRAGLILIRTFIDTTSTSAAKKHENFGGEYSYTLFDDYASWPSIVRTILRAHRRKGLR